MSLLCFPILDKTTEKMTDKEMNIERQPTMKKILGKTAWKEKEVLPIRYLKDKLTELQTRLSSDAWLGLGIK